MRRIIVLAVLSIMGLVFVSGAHPRFQPQARGHHGMTGSSEPRIAYASEGERLYYSAISASGQPIRFTGGPRWLRMHGGSCVICHGKDARGGFPIHMCGKLPPQIVHFGFLPAELFANAVTQGQKLDGQPLDPCMPRWQMGERELTALTNYLRTLTPAQK